ncbi:MAG: Eco57I restriction-modification methylase domain-containing protein [Anaerolineaceae bacterium]
MNKENLEQLIKDFSIDRLAYFFERSSNKFSRKQESLDNFNDDSIKNGIKLGEIKFDETEELIICAFFCEKTLSERSGKTAQYEKAKTILDKRNSDAGIFVFYDENHNFWFSLIYANYQGKRREWSPPRRFTYYVSKELTNKTFLHRIGECDFSSLEIMKEAFSVKKVTDKFFEEFRIIFEKTKDEFEKTNKNTVCLWLKDRYSEEEYKEQINKFTFTFLGRIIFLYFLLRKGWIEDQKDFIRKIINDEEQSNLYLRVFQPLFFDVFATKESDRILEIKNIYKNTPYLNGGLFEKSDLENEMLKAGKFVLFEDKFIREIIINFFETYNFTVDENSPNDQEVSIDPEMLGKVFENTLAEEERGKKGTFYTPREVVHFMVKDAICQFLINETSINENLLHCFIFDEDFNLDQFSKENIRLLDLKLDGLKVLDPAVGSAAFPVEMMQVLVSLRKRLSVKVGLNISEVSLKKSFIKNNLYGVDIDPSAIEIAKLRLWLALIVDYDKADAEPLPNLDFQFRVGNSLQEKIDGFDIFNEEDIGIEGLFKDQSEYERMKDRMIQIKDQFYLPLNENEKRKLKNEFDNLEHKLINAVLEKYRGEFNEQLKNQRIGNSAKAIQGTIQKITHLEQKIKDGTYKLFKPDFHFSEVFDRKNEGGEKTNGFDIVIGNPPYGVTVENDIKEWHGLGSKDSYGVFISTALKRFLKKGGVLSYIVSDTWLTIKTHKPLREQVLKKQLHKVVRMHQDCFEATVNACIINLTNNSDVNNDIIAADLTNISTRREVEELRNKLYHLDEYIGVSTPKYAVYQYNQGLIKSNSNIPIFVGSPKLFCLMNDQTCQTSVKEISREKIKTRIININNKAIELVRFGDIADIRVGLQTGNNHAYLYQNPEVHGTYRNINEYKQYLLTESDLGRIANNECIRMKVIEQGIHRSKDEKNFDEDLWFNGRYIVPYDKGGESNTENSWLPNYYVPTDYFIDWSCYSVKELSTFRTARFQNKSYYFKNGLTLSYTGQYAPNLRFNSMGVFDVGGSSIFPMLDSIQILGNFVCKITKYLGKIYIDHSVNFQVDENKEIPMLIENSFRISELVNKIIDKQKREPRYDYMKNEQNEIDKLVYEMYGLNDEDILEVETWYARRYPKLV